jgi:hypothetical protein
MSAVRLQLISRRLRQIRNQLPLFASRASQLSDMGSRAHVADIRKARRKFNQLREEEKTLMAELDTPALEGPSVTYLQPGEGRVPNPDHRAWKRIYKMPVSYPKGKAK